MTKAEYLRRKQAGEPIESGWELVHALQEVRERLKPNTRLWYLMNRFAREAMDDAEHAKPERQRTMRYEIHLNVDDWAVCRLAQLREQRETAQLCAVIDEDKRVTDLYIVRADGAVERSPGK